MATPDAPKQTSENPHFALANQLMTNYIGALGLAKKMQERGNLDPLTGVPNRYALEESFAGLRNGDHQRVSDADESELADTHSLLILDIDHFKQINDTHGHVRGDRVLRKIASTIQDTVRKRDLAVRIGGEEFAVLLPRTTSEQAVEVGEKIRLAAEATGDGTLSVGVAGINLDKTLEDNVFNADLAMYDAKDQGRNQVVRYEDLVARQQNGSTPRNI